MTIEFKGKTISNIVEWEKEIFSDAKKMHWKVGRSAYSLAEFIINKNGEHTIIDEVSKIIGESLILDNAHPEYEVQFDNYGHGREHDLGIYGTTKSGKKVFIGVEAKVDEPFGNTISQAYIKGKAKQLNGENTNAPIRIEELLKRNYGNIKGKYFDLPYQLLFSTVGTLSVKADIHILFVIVFKTSLSDPLKVKDNKKKYDNFFKELGAKKLYKDCYKVNIDGNTLYSLYITV